MRFCCRFTRFRVKTPESRVKRNRRIRKPSAETPQKPSSHVFGGLLERLEEAVRDGFGRGVPMRRVGIHLLGKGRNLGQPCLQRAFPIFPEQGKLLLQRKDGMFPQFGNGVGLGKLFAHPRLREADIGWSQYFRALRLDLIRNPQVDFQKRTHCVRILFRERAIRDKEYGLRCTAILRMRRDFEPERFGLAGERRPDGKDIAVPVLKRAEGGCRFQFLDLDVLLLKPERGEPFVEQIAGRRFFWGTG